MSPTAPQIPKHTFVRRIGGGGFGDVYLYLSLEPRRQVAVKVVREAALSGDAAARFLDEANAMAGVEHAHIVTVYSVGRTTDGRPYFSMKYYPDGTIEQRLERGPLTVPEVLRIGIEIGGAVESAHRANLIHRDIKPANILVGQDGATALTDFGVAAELIASATDDEVGVSPPWSPPEMLYTDARGDVSSDVYSLAATLWHLLVGRAPFEIPRGDNSRLAIMTRVRDAPVPSTGRSDVPPALDGLLRRAMSKNPGARPATVADFVLGLQQVQSERGLAPTNPGFLGSPRSFRGSSASPAVDDVPATTRRPASSQRPPGIERTDPTRGTARTADRSWVVAPDPESVPTQFKSPRSSTVIAPIDAAARRPVVDRRWLVGGAVLLVVAASAVGVALVGAGRDPTSGKPLSRVTPSGEPSLQQVSGPPGKVSITSERSGGQVRFSWTYDNAWTTDGFRVRISNSDTVTTLRPELSIPAPTNRRICVQVQVRRADSTQTTEWSARHCG